MNRLTIFLTGALILAACAHTAPVTKQANFDRACTYARGAAATASPVIPVLAPKLGESGVLAAQALLAAIKTTCATSLDVNNADAVIQRVYDIGGQVIALVITATGGPPA